MGIRFLILQMIPWCFPMAGSGATACHEPDAPSSPAVATAGVGGGYGKSPSAVKLIMADGRVEVYHRPVSVAELMSGHPMHLVCRSDAFTIGQRIPALSEAEELQPGHAYFLLPVHFFQSVLSFVTLASSSFSLLQQRSFDVCKTPSGLLQIKVSDEFLEKMEAQEGGAGGGGGCGGRVCTTAALEKDYRQLVGGSRARQWKPKLETIKESERGRGRERGRLVAMGGAAAALGHIGQRRKKGHQMKQQQQKQHQQQKHQQQKEEKHKVSTIPQFLSSPPPHKSKGKKVVAYDL